MMLHHVIISHKTNKLTNKDKDVIFVNNEEKTRFIHFLYNNYTDNRGIYTIERQERSSDLFCQSYGEWFCADRTYYRKRGYDCISHIA